MAKLPVLLKNELLKLTARWSNRTLAILLVFMAALSAGLQWFSWKNGATDQREEGRDTLQTQIEALLTEQPEGYEEQLESLQFLLANNIDVSVNNWRLVAAQRITDDFQRRNALLKTGSKTDREEADRLTASILEDRELVITKDYRGYYQKRLDTVSRDKTLSETDRSRLLFQYQYVLDYKVAAEGSEWKYNLMLGLVAAMNELQSQQAQRAKGASSNPQYERELTNTIAIARYRIEQEKPVVAGDASSGFYYEEPSRFWLSMSTSVQTIPLLALAVIILAGSIISGEFSSGTAKLLLCTPVKRWKLLTAKYLAVLLCSLALLIGFYLASTLASASFFGFRDVGGSFIYAVDGQAREVSGFLYIGWLYLLQSVEVLVYGASAFCLSALFRSTAIAVGLNAFFLFAGPYLVSWLQYNLDQDWVRYLLFANLDLAAIWNGQDVFPGQTVLFALAIVAVHVAVFLLAAWDAFLYRDVK